MDILAALRAARAPRDPVAELREAWDGIASRWSFHDYERNRMNAAIAAIDGRDGE